MIPPVHSPATAIESNSPGRERGGPRTHLLSPTLHALALERLDHDRCRSATIVHRAILPLSLSGERVDERHRVKRAVPACPSAHGIGSYRGAAHGIGSYRGAARSLAPGGDRSRVVVARAAQGSVAVVDHALPVGALLPSIREPACGCDHELDQAVGRTQEFGTVPVVKAAQAVDGANRVAGRDSLALCHGAAPRDARHEHSLAFNSQTVDPGLCQSHAKSLAGSLEDGNRPDGRRDVACVRRTPGTWRAPEGSRASSDSIAHATKRD
mmetsp:Transcript_74299/g.204688  ORF Transcript_74299/g.204688 Transcript_74299/m.204688 type:complete len:268 (+) Transcript_74299:243-1046(+)